MTDPLGQSQVIPYLIGLSKQGYRFTLLSAEKAQSYPKNRQHIAALLQQNNIDWQPISFSTSPPILAKFWDIYRLKKKALQLHQQNKFDLCHCRSYVSAFVGEYLKKKANVPLLFDMRGFWVDERVDGNLWNTKQVVYRKIYRYYKQREKQLLALSDGVVVLSEAGKKELLSWYTADNAPKNLVVIPCAVDTELFKPLNSNQKKEARRTLHFTQSDLVISYLGSIGTWYLLDEMLQFFKQLQSQYPSAKFLFITTQSPELITNKAAQYGISSHALTILKAPRKKVPFYLSASDLNIGFYKQAYSKIASSPVKLGEVLCMGIPVISNTKIGDVAQIIENTNSGITINTFSPKSYQKIIDQLPHLLEKKPNTIIPKALAYYNLPKAIAQYASLYKTLLP